MRREFSGYLDAVRFGAALLVFACHMTFPQFTGGVVAYQANWAGFAVTCFFVLSGYVISYVADKKEKTLTSFTISRLARIYSVALPALILTVVIDLIGFSQNWTYHAPAYQYAKFPGYFLLSLFFGNQTLIFREPVFGDGVFWSLDYEVWYYIIFAAATYYTGWRRGAATLLFLVIAGPRAVLDLPLWLMGAAVYHVHQRVRLQETAALAVFLTSIALFLVFRLSGTDGYLNQEANVVLHGWPHAFLSNSMDFASDYIDASLVAVNFFAAGYLRLRLFSIPAVARTATYAASFTFVLYLTHRQLMNLYAFALPYDPHRAADVARLVGMVLVSVWLLGFLTEHRKAWWRTMFALLLERGRGVLKAAAPAVYRLVAP